jgi:hypothetical protein
VQVFFFFLFGISGDAMKFLQHLLESNSSVLTFTIALRRFSYILFLAFVLTEDTRESTLPNTALLKGLIKEVRAKMARSLNA